MLIFVSSNIVNIVLEKNGEKQFNSVFLKIIQLAYSFMDLLSDFLYVTCLGEHFTHIQDTSAANHLSINKF